MFSDWYWYPYCNHMINLNALNNCSVDSVLVCMTEFVGGWCALPGAPPGILGPTKKKKKKSFLYVFQFFGGPCQLGALGAVLTFPPYTAPLCFAVMIFRVLHTQSFPIQIEKNCINKNKMLIFGSQHNRIQWKIEIKIIIVSRDILATQGISLLFRSPLLTKIDPVPWHTTEAKYSHCQTQTMSWINEFLQCLIVLNLTNLGNNGTDTRREGRVPVWSSPGKTLNCSG